MSLNSASSSDASRWMRARNSHIRIGPKYQAQLPDLIPSARNERICVPKQMTKPIPHCIQHLYKNGNNNIHTETKIKNKSLSESEEDVENNDNGICMVKSSLECEKEKVNNGNNNEQFNNENLLKTEIADAFNGTESDNDSVKNSKNTDVVACDVLLGAEAFVDKEDEEENDRTVEEKIKESSREDTGYHVTKYFKNIDGNRKKTGEDEMEERREIDAEEAESGQTKDTLNETICINAVSDNNLKLEEEIENDIDAQSNDLQNKEIIGEMLDQKNSVANGEVYDGLMTLANVEIPTDITEEN